MSFSELHFYLCTNFYVGPFFIIFLLLLLHFFLMFGRVRVWLWLYSIWEFNKEFYPYSFFYFHFVFDHLLNITTSAESYHYKSKHSTHSFKRLLKTFRAKRYSYFFFVSLVGLVSLAVYAVKANKRGRVKWCERVFVFFGLRLKSIF